ncbi:MAG TPA: efflux RND transporter periplasmic adaptor subunit [Vicinamibacteria bacterium]
MNTSKLLLGAAVGSALLVATVLQARQAALATSPAAAAPAADATASGRLVAAEGRVAAYPGAEVLVSAERGGRLVRLAVVEGQAVRRGELLAEIEGEELRASRREAEARLAEAEAQATLAAAELSRRRRLVEERILAQQDLDQARRDVEVAAATAGRARASIALYDAQLAKTRVVSPLSGTVIARHADSGETVETGDPVVTVADLTRVRVEGEADEADAGLLAVGRPARVTAQGWPGRSWRGTIEEVSDAVSVRRLKPQDPARPADTRVVGLKVALLEPTPLKLGTTVDLRIEAEP